MSRFITKTDHTPTFNRYSVERSRLLAVLLEAGIEPMIDAPEGDPYVLSYWWSYTDLEGWSKVIPDLLIASDLYKPDIFVCWGYALNAQVECARRYKLNTLLMCIGTLGNHTAKHAFNVFPYGDEQDIQGLMLFEPNEGYTWAGNAFDIGKNGYTPQYVLLTQAMNPRI